jgi:hypothetical protein
VACHAELQMTELVPLAPTDQFFVLRIYVPAHAHPGSRPRNGRQQYPSGWAFGLKQSRNQNIRIQDNPDHGFEDGRSRRAFRAAAISASISSMES